jgi:hypothetical protein
MINLYHRQMSTNRKAFLLKVSIQISTTEFATTNPNRTPINFTLYSYQSLAMAQYTNRDLQNLNASSERLRVLDTHGWGKTPWTSRPRRERPKRKLSRGNDSS